MPVKYPPAAARRANRTQHPAVCDDCGLSTTLPFLPNQGKPVYCRSCFKARRRGLSVQEHARAASAHLEKPCVENRQAVDSVPSAAIEFSEMHFEVLYQGRDFPDEHISPHSHSG